jgi:hypothetical protein
MDTIATNSCAAKQQRMTVEEFNWDFRDWIRAQQEDFDKDGVWSEGLVPWQIEGCGDSAS